MKFLKNSSRLTIEKESFKGLLFLLLMSLLFVPQVQSSSAKLAVKEWTYVYSLPSEKAGEKLALAQPGQIYELLSKSRSGKYYKIKNLKKAVEGWVPSDKMIVTQVELRHEKFDLENPRNSSFVKIINEDSGTSSISGELDTGYYLKETKGLSYQFALAYGQKSGIAPGLGVNWVLPFSGLRRSQWELSPELSYYDKFEGKSISSSLLEAAIDIKWMYSFNGATWSMGPLVGYSYFNSFDDVELESNSSLYMGVMARYRVKKTMRLFTKLKYYNQEEYKRSLIQFGLNFKL